MQNFLGKLFRFRPDETGVVFTLSLVLFANALARQVIGIVAISGLLSEGGVNQVLLVWFIDYAIILLTGGLQSLIVDRFNRLSLMKWLTVIMAVIFVLTRLLFTLDLPTWFNYGLLYIIAEQQFVFFPLVFWVLANDIYDMSESKRLFPFISSWNFIGVIVGTGLSALLPVILEKLSLPIESVLWFNVVLYLACYAGLAIGLRHARIRKTAQKSETVRETLTEGWNFLKDVPSFRYLMIAIAILAVCDTIIEFRFLVVSDAVFTTQDSYQQFYSLYRLFVTLVAFILQSTLTSRIIERYNIKNTFLLFPLFVIVTAISTILLPGIQTAVFAIATVKLARDTVDASSRKTFQSLVPEERRGRVSTFMDSYLPAIGTMTACLVTGAIVLISQATAFNNSYYLYLGITAVGGIIAIWAIFKMRTVYDKSLLNWRLKRRQRDSSVLNKLEF